VTPTGGFRIRTGDVNGNGLPGRDRGARHSPTPRLAGGEPIVTQQVEDQGVAVDTVLVIVPLPAAGEAVSLLGQRRRRAPVDLPDMGADGVEVKVVEAVFEQEMFRFRAIPLVPECGEQIAPRLPGPVDQVEVVDVQAADHLVR